MRVSSTYTNELVCSCAVEAGARLHVTRVLWIHNWSSSIYSDRIPDTKIFFLDSDSMWICLDRNVHGTAEHLMCFILNASRNSRRKYRQANNTQALHPTCSQLFWLNYATKSTWISIGSYAVQVNNIALLSKFIDVNLLAHKETHRPGSSSRSLSFRGFKSAAKRTLPSSHPHPQPPKNISQVAAENFCTANRTFTMGCC